MRKTTMIVKITCSAPEVVFTEKYEDIPEDIRYHIETYGALQCEGSGNMNIYCEECYWAGEWDVEWEEN